MKYGVIQQYKGPFSPGYTITLEKSYKIGISIGEKDFMKLGSENEPTSFVFYINGEEIHMGRTCMYESDSPISSGSISFPDGAAQSVIVEIAYCE